MKVLFLDIDGVLNCESTEERIGTTKMLGIDRFRASMVRTIVNMTGCEIVLSSTWRLDEWMRQVVRHEVHDYIDVTGSSPTHFRGREVMEWMMDYGQTVEKWAILDDDGDFWPWQPLFKTSFKTGLTPEITQQVIDHLGREFSENSNMRS